MVGGRRVGAGRACRDCAPKAEATCLARPPARPPARRRVFAPSRTLAARGRKAAADAMPPRPRAVRAVAVGRTRPRGGRARQWERVAASALAAEDGEAAVVPRARPVRRPDAAGDGSRRAAVDEQPVNLVLQARGEVGGWARWAVPRAAGQSDAGGPRASSRHSGRDCTRKQACTEVAGQHGAAPQRAPPRERVRRVQRTRVSLSESQAGSRRRGLPSHSVRPAHTRPHSPRCPSWSRCWWSACAPSRAMGCTGC